MSTIKVCSFNLRVDNAHDGINKFTNRFSRVIEVIRREAPDIIGFQEATDSMRASLADELREYTVLGCGRSADYLGESTAVAVRRDRFGIVSYENFWLSFTPLIPGSTFGSDQSNCPRVATSVLLKPNDSDSTFRFCNTHLDHKGETARLLGISQIMQYLSRFPEKFVLTGDFNASPSSPVVNALAGFSHNGSPVLDATRNITGTFHGFGSRPVLSKIDYIFSDADANPDKAYAIAEPPLNGVYVSDHHPVVAYIEL